MRAMYLLKCYTYYFPFCIKPKPTGCQPGKRYFFGDNNISLSRALISNYFSRCPFQSAKHSEIAAVRLPRSSQMSW